MWYRSLRRKASETTDVGNYRVIANCSAILKVFERAIKVASIIEPQLSNSQHGFRSRRTVTTNLLNQMMIVHEAFERKGQLDTFFGDYKSAFDRVSHRLLIIKMSKFGIGPNTAEWICNYLVGMMYFVQSNHKSRVFVSTSGIIPGSVLGPLLFTIFINNVVEVVKCSKVQLFADDIKLLKIVLEWSDVMALQNDINSVVQWNKENRLCFNEYKCAIFTAYRTATYIDATYKLDDYKIDRKNEIRDLGVLLDCKYTFAHHIEQLTAHARQVNGYIRRISNGRFSKETLKILYISYVRSKLEFSSPIWSPYQQVYIDDIESVQKQLVIELLESRKNATSYRLAPYSERCDILNMQPLEVRRQVADALLAFDIYRGNVKDTCVSSRIVSSGSVRELRCNRLVIEKYYSSDYLRQQPVLRFVRIINEFADFVSSSRSEFKAEAVRRYGLRYSGRERE